jgi:hypothetical protein
MRFGSNIDEQLRNTTNDMTVNGKLVVGEYAQGTTVLEQGNRNASYIFQSQPQYEEAKAQNASISFMMPQEEMDYTTSRSNTLCRILAYPLNFIVCVLAAILLSQNGDSESIIYTVGIAMLGIGVCALIANRNKNAIGIALLTLSLGYIVEGLTVLLGGVHEELPVQSFVIMISGVLLLCGGISILTQREARLGGALCMVAIVVEWVFILYQLANGGANIELWHIFVCIATFTTFVWSYGYDSREKTVGIQKVLCIVAYVFSAIVAIRGISQVINVVSTILG